MIAEIANVHDERVEKASETESRFWLRQLVALWSAERAVVLTFNYDTLLERAVNASMLVTGGTSGNLQRLRGDHVVFPAPPATQPQFMGTVRLLTMLSHFKFSSFTAHLRGTGPLAMRAVQP